MSGLGHGRVSDKTARALCLTDLLDAMIDALDTRNGTESAALTIRREQANGSGRSIRWWLAKGDRRSGLRRIVASHIAITDRRDFPSLQMSR